jgi:hypothetical protein
MLRIKILQILYAHFSSEDPDRLKSEKELLFSISTATKGCILLSSCCLLHQSKLGNGVQLACCGLVQ